MKTTPKIGDCVRVQYHPCRTQLVRVTYIYRNGYTFEGHAGTGRSDTYAVIDLR